MKLSDEATSRPQARGVLRIALLVVAWLSALLGLIGIFVPGLPTTVFILLSAWAASRSSPRFHAWLECHPVFGQLLRDWRDGRRVSRRAKWTATVSMSLCAFVLFITSAPWRAIIVTTLMAVVLVWLWCRPQPPAVGATPEPWE